MRSSSVANSAASSPPAPARISTITLRSSFGSRGRSETRRSSSSAVSRASSSLISSRAIAFISSSGSPSRMLARAVELLAHVAQLAVRRDDGLEARQLAAEPAQRVGVGQDLGRGELRRHVVVLAGEVRQLGVEAGSSVIVEASIRPSAGERRVGDRGDGVGFGGPRGRARVRRLLFGRGPDAGRGLAGLRHRESRRGRGRPPGPRRRRRAAPPPWPRSRPRSCRRSAAWS